jgi:hypothetical protein
MLPANIFMMQAVNTFEFDDSALIWRLFPASFRLDDVQ